MGLQWQSACRARQAKRQAVFILRGQRRKRDAFWSSGRLVLRCVRAHISSLAALSLQRMTLGLQIDSRIGCSRVPMATTWYT